MNRYLLVFFVNLLFTNSTFAAFTGNICSSSFSNEDSGVINDSGGASGSYSNYENCGFLIQPTSSPDEITLSFSQFQVEQGYDFLRVFDGDSSAGTLLGQFTGNSIPSDVTATSGSMYLQFRSDYIVRADGFTASWNSKVSGGTGVSCASNNVQDVFSSLSYSNNNGSQNWATTWQEVGESDGPSAGQSRVDNSNCSSGYCLRIGTPSGVFASQYSNRGASREVNLTGAASATLTFNYFTGFGDGTANVLLQVSNNGGSSWTTLRNYPINSTNFSANPERFDLTPYIAENTQIRFIGSGSYGSNTGMYIDDINIAYEVCQAPTPVAEYRFDETSWSGTTDEVIDSSNNNYHGTAFNTQPTQGLVCNAADFTANSINDYISINNAALNNKNDFSISVWARTKIRVVNQWYREHPAL